MAACGALMIPLQMMSYSLFEQNMGLIQLFQANCVIMAVAGVVMSLGDRLQHPAPHPLLPANTTADEEGPAHLEHLPSSTALWSFVLVLLLIFRVSKNNKIKKEKEKEEQEERRKKEK